MASPAFAAGGTCPASPSNWDAAACNSVCTTTVTAFTCDVSAAGGTSRVTIVSDYSTASNYEAWGDVNGTLFCCVSDPMLQPPAVYIYGSAYGDYLEFTYDAMTYNLNGIAGAITAKIYGGAGHDNIKGSHAQTNIAEYLYGEAGNDTIAGNADDDELYGGTGDDTMMGGAGDDTMAGGDNSDTMIGGAGDDVMYGDAARDFMSGNEGDDDMDGGAGPDVLCGNDQSSGDLLDDGDGVDDGLIDDVLWSSISLDYATCGHASTSWDGFANIVSGCSASNPVIASQPSQCP